MNKKFLIVGAVILVGLAVYFGSGFLSKPGPETSNTPTPSVAKGACRPTGCSGQICADEDVVTTCEYRAVYACYRTAKCERQADGTCGWTQTAALKTCLGTSR